MRPPGLVGAATGEDRTKAARRSPGETHRSVGATFSCRAMLSRIPATQSFWLTSLNPTSPNGSALGALDAAGVAGAADRSGS